MRRCWTLGLRGSMINLLVELGGSFPFFWGGGRFGRLACPFSLRVMDMDGLENVFL